MLHDTYQLVHKLSPQQSDFVQRYAALYSPGKQPNYMVLFDSLLRLPEWNETQLREELSSSGFVNRLAHTANYLEEIILRCLRHMPGSNNPRSQQQFTARLADVRILCNKGLLPQAEEIIYQLEQMQLEAEDYAGLCRFARYAVDLEKLTGKPSFGNQSATERFKKYLAIHKSEQHLLSISTLIMQHKIHKHFNELEPALQQRLINYTLLPEVSNEKLALSTQARYQQLGIAEKIYEETSEEKLIETLLKKISLLESHPAYLEANPILLLNTLDSLLLVYAQDKYFALFEPVLKKLLAIQTKNELRFGRFISFQVSHAVLYYAAIGNELNLGRYLQTGQDALDRHGHLIRTVSQHVMYSSMAHACILAGKYSLAIDIINNAITKNGKDFRPDLLAFIRYMQFVAHYYLGNTEILEHLVRSSIRFTDAHSKRLSIDVVIIRLLRKLATAPTAGESAEAANEALTGLIDLQKREHSREYVIYTFWKVFCQALITQVPLHEYSLAYHRSLLNPTTQL